MTEGGGVWNMALRVEVCVEYVSESGGVWNMALTVEVCGILHRVEVCGIWL